MVNSIIFKAFSKFPSFAQLNKLLFVVIIVHEPSATLLICERSATTIHTWPTNALFVDNPPVLQTSGFPLRVVLWGPSSATSPRKVRRNVPIVCVKAAVLKVFSAGHDFGSYATSVSITKIHIGISRICSVC